MCRKVLHHRTMTYKWLHSSSSLGRLNKTFNCALYTSSLELFTISKWLIKWDDNAAYHWSEWYVPSCRLTHSCPAVSSLFSKYVCVSYSVFYDCTWHLFCSWNDPGYVSSGWNFLLFCQAGQPAGRCNLQWHSTTRASVQISVLKQKRPQQMWYCKTTSLEFSRVGYSNVK